MTDYQVTEAAEPAAGSFCPSCGTPVNAASAFCGKCGCALTVAHTASPPVDTAPPHESFPPPPAQAQMGAPPPLGYPGAPAGYPYMYPVQAPPKGTNTGLIVGLVAAGLAAVGAIVAIILLAAGGSGNSPRPTITPAAATIPATGPTVTPVAPTAGTALTASSGSGSRVRHHNGSAGSHTAPVSTTASATPAGGVADIDAVRQVVLREWGFINAGNFSAAYSLFMPGTVGGESAFVSGHQQDAPISASVTVGTPTFNSSTAATVPLLSLRTNDATNGCKTWTGSYDVQQASGQWLINQANLQSQAC